MYTMKLCKTAHRCWAAVFIKLHLGHCEPRMFMYQAQFLAHKDGKLSRDSCSLSILAAGFKTAVGTQL